VATVGAHLTSIFLANGYSGASPNYAKFTQFNSSGQPVGGYAPLSLITSGSHSNYHSLQTSVSKNSTQFGLGFQASYTYSKSMDDSSSALGSVNGSPGVILQTLPENPWNPGAEGGPSSFDVTHVFALSLIEALPVDRVGFLRPLGKHFMEGWQFLNITTLMIGLPYTVYPDIQQTGFGAGGADRPDQIAQPSFSTSRTVREDHLGHGANNVVFFSIAAI
jgi:hypothetical protein